MGEFYEEHCVLVVSENVVGISSGDHSKALS